MYGYLINRFEIVDREQFKKYVAAVVPIIQAHKGELLVGNEAAHVVEGSAPRMTVVIRFPSEKDAFGFWDSPEYQPVKPLRTGATANHSCIIVSGDVMSV